jgi:pre-mRNA-processing factor 39
MALVDPVCCLQDRTDAIFQRCLIACVSYAEFWQRYAFWKLGNGGPVQAAAALARAIDVFLPSRADLHLLRARFLEMSGDVEGAIATFDKLWR